MRNLRAYFPPRFAQEGAFEKRIFVLLLDRGVRFPRRKGRLRRIHRVLSDQVGETPEVFFMEDVRRALQYRRGFFPSEIGPLPHPSGIRILEMRIRIPSCRDCRKNPRHTRLPPGIRRDSRIVQPLGGEVFQDGIPRVPGSGKILSGQRMRSVMTIARSEHSLGAVRCARVRKA